VTAGERGPVYHLRKPDGTYGYYSGTTADTTIDIVTGNVPGTATDQRLVCLWLDPSDGSITSTASSTTSTSTDLKLSPSDAFPLINECLETAPDNSIGLQAFIIFGDTDNITIANRFHDLRGIVNTASRGNRRGVVTKTADYTTTALDEVVFVDASSNDVTITLVSASGIEGIQHNIKRVDDSSSYTVTIDGDSSETIDGETTITLDDQYAAVTIVSDGTNWLILW